MIGLSLNDKIAINDRTILYAHGSVRCVVSFVLHLKFLNLVFHTR